jgi:S-adenosylmethionine:tRNA ribosyltransferase-isomerase
MITLDAGLDFQLPDELMAHEPPEARGLARDEVRLMVSRLSDNRIAHTRFPHLPDFLAPGDVLVINTSATIDAAFEAVRETRDGSMSAVVLHLITARQLGTPTSPGNGH